MKTYTLQIRGSINLSGWSKQITERDNMAAERHAYDLLVNGLIHCPGVQGIAVFNDGYYISTVRVKFTPQAD